MLSHGVAQLWDASDLCGIMRFLSPTLIFVLIALPRRVGCWGRNSPNKCQARGFRLVWNREGGTARERPDFGTRVTCGTLSSSLISRRWLIGGAIAASVLPRRRSFARGRVPFGAAVSLRLPWPLGSMDPHALDDVSASFLGSALFDSLYVSDDRGAFRPALAEAPPSLVDSEVRIKLREGLLTGAGLALDARDVFASLQRAKQGPGAQFFGPLFGPLRMLRGEIAFAMKTPDLDLVQQVLASSAFAIVPRTFRPETPDGTGPFMLRRRGDGWSLMRNPLAAMGPPPLREIRLREAKDLTDSLRAFESGEDDLGWLGRGFHDLRPESRTFDAGMLGFAILRAGTHAPGWSVPGNMQRIVDGLAPAQFASFGIPGWTEAPLVQWPFQTESLVARDDSPWLADVAKLIATLLSKPGAPGLSVRLVAAAELRALRQSGDYALMLDTVRTWDGLPSAWALRSAALAPLPPHTAGDLDALRKPEARTARVVGRTSPFGVLGEIRVTGGVSKEIHLAAQSSSMPWSHLTRLKP
jgi:peptide/nickel transport system substrate-binding protein